MISNPEAETWALRLTSACEAGNGEALGKALVDCLASDDEADTVLILLAMVSRGITRSPYRVVLVAEIVERLAQLLPGATHLGRSTYALEAMLLAHNAIQDGDSPDGWVDVSPAALNDPLQRIAIRRVLADVYTLEGEEHGKPEMACSRYCV